MNPFAMAFAADHTTIGYEPDTHVPDAVVVLNEEDEVALILTPEQAVAVATRLLTLAGQVTDARRPLRRPSTVDERLRGLDE